MEAADYERLRKELIDYFGTAIFAGNPVATVYLAETKTAGYKRLKEIARQCGYEIDDFEDEEE